MPPAASSTAQLEQGDGDDHAALSPRSSLSPPSRVDGDAGGDHDDDLHRCRDDNVEGGGTQTNDDEDLDGRVARCRDLIRRMAREATARVRDRESTVVGVGVGSGTGAGEEAALDQLHMDDKESFELGMALFGGGGDGGGSDSSGALLLGSMIDGEKLAGIEDELRDLSRLLHREEAETENLPGLRNRDLVGGGAAPPGGGDKASSSMPTMTAMTPEERQAEVGRLRSRLSFLSGCDGALRSLRSVDGGDSLDSTRNTLGRRAEAARKAETLLRDAERPLLKLASDDDATWDDEMGVVAEAVRAEIRSVTSEVSSRARSILDSHLEVTPDSICVKIEVRDGTPSSPALSDAFDALVALSSSPPSDSGEGGDCRGTGTGSSSTELDDVMSDLAADLLRVVLRPMLPTRPSSSEGGVPSTVTTTFREHLGDGRHPTLEWTIASSSASKPSTAGGPTSLSSSSLSAVGEVVDDGDGEDDGRHPYSSSLRSVSTVLEFVRRNLLLGRDDLCRAIGLHLLGASGSAGGRRGATLRGGGGGAGPDGPLDDEDDDDLFLSGDEEDHRDGALARDLLRLLHDCIPSKVNEFVVTKPILQKSTERFEETMRSLSLLPSTDKGSGMKMPLSPVSSTLDRRYAENRRTTILSTGREMLGRDYHNTVLVGDDEEGNFDGGSGSSSDDAAFFSGGDVDEALHAASSVFRFPRCAVSIVASDLLKLVTSTLDEAAAAAAAAAASSSDTDGIDPSARLPAVLYRTSRELLDLFRAVVPALHRRELADDPRTAAVFHDDCCLLAHKCSTLGLRYRDRFAAAAGAEDGGGGGSDDGVLLLGGVCTFVDMVPPFREMADSCLGEMVERHKAMIVDEVMGLDGGGGGGGSGVGEFRVTLRMNEGDVSWNDAETAVQRGLHHLKQLSRAWTGVLPVDVYRRAMGNLVDTLFAVMLDPVTSAEDVSEAASHFVSSLFGSTLKASSELFFCGGSGGGGDPDVPRRSCGLWDRFTAVCRFMDMSSMSDVGDALASGTFRSLTGPELAALVTATFDDSERRRTLLRALLESSD